MSNQDIVAFNLFFNVDLYNGIKFHLEYHWGGGKAA